MGSPCLFTRQRALQMGYFYLLRVKNSKATRKTQSSILKVKLHLLTEAVLLHLSCFWMLGYGSMALFQTVPSLA